MADRYWVGGAGTWNATNIVNWSATSGGAGGASVPTSADAVFFNANSGFGTVTNSSGVSCLSLNCTGYIGTLSGSLNAIQVYGNITLGSGMTALNLAFLVQRTSTLISATKTIGSLTVNDQVLSLGDNLTTGFLSTSGTGSFNTSATNYSILCTGNIWFGGTGTVTLNASAIQCDGWVAPTVTLNVGTSTITLSGIGNNGFAGGGKTYYNIAVSSIGNKPIGTFTCTSLTITGAANSTSFTSLSGDITVTGPLSITGNNIAPNRVLIKSNTNGTARTITANGSRSVTNANFSDITIVGAALTGTSLGNCLGCTNITFTGAVARYAEGTGNWSNTGVWASLSGGATGASVPLPQDTVIFDAASGAITVTMDTTYVPTITCTGFTGTLNTGTGSRQIYGNLTLASGMTVSGTGTWSLLSRSAGTINTAGKTLYSIYIGDTGFAYSYTANTSVDSTYLYLYGGTFNASTANINASTFNCYGSSIMTLNMGSGTWTISGAGTVWSITATSLTLNAQTSNIVLSATSTTARTFEGGGKSYPKLTIGGTTGISTLDITGANTFAEIASTKTVAHTIIFPSGGTTTIGKWSVAGTTGNLVTIRATVSLAATLAYSGIGKVDTNYLDVSYITGSPALTWYVGSGSINSGNNTNIYFFSSNQNNLFFGSNF